MRNMKMKRREMIFVKKFKTYERFLKKSNIYLRFLKNLCYLPEV